MMNRFSPADLTTDPVRPSRASKHRPASAQARTTGQAAIIDLICALAASLALTIAIVGLLAH